MRIFLQFAAEPLIKPNDFYFVKRDHQPEVLVPYLPTRVLYCGQGKSAPHGGVQVPTSNQRQHCQDQGFQPMTMLPWMFTTTVDVIFEMKATAGDKCRYKWDLSKLHIHFVDSNPCTSSAQMIMKNNKRHTITTRQC